VVADLAAIEVRERAMTFSPNVTSPITRYGVIGRAFIVG
jgi:hypothetical protein